MQPFILAADFGNIVVLIIFVISIVSGIINLIQGNKPDGTPRVKQPNKSAPDLENLLRQLMGEPAKRKQEPKPPKPPKRQNQNSERKKQNQNPALERPAMSRAPIPPRQTNQSRQTSPGTESREPLLAPSNLGGSVRSHHLGNRVDQAVEKDISKAVTADLGIGVMAAGKTERPEHPLVGILRDPNGVRNAILLNEVLNRPKALRR